MLRRYLIGLCWMALVDDIVTLATIPAQFRQLRRRSWRGGGPEGGAPLSSQSGEISGDRVLESIRDSGSLVVQWVERQSHGRKVLGSTFTRLDLLATPVSLWSMVCGDLIRGSSSRTTSVMRSGAVSLEAVDTRLCSPENMVLCFQRVHGTGL